MRFREWLEIDEMNRRDFLKGSAALGAGAAIGMMPGDASGSDYAVMLFQNNNLHIDLAKKKAKTPFGQKKLQEMDALNRRLLDQKDVAGLKRLKGEVKKTILDGDIDKAAVRPIAQNQLLPNYAEYMSIRNYISRNKSALEKYAVKVHAEYDSLQQPAMQKLQTRKLMAFLQRKGINMSEEEVVALMKDLLADQEYQLNLKALRPLR